MSLDRYVLDHVLFEAAPSTFYAAKNAILGNEVTVRRLTLDPERAEDAKDTFFREQRLAASLAHPRIQRPVDIFQADGAVWSVHERGEVQRTDDRVEREGPLSLTEAMRLGSQMAEALSHMHAAGLVFGRMSPASVLVSTRGDAELINLVKAADMKAGIWPLRPPVQALSAFSAPEELDGERPTVASDVYGLAATLVYWLTGLAPYGDGTAEGALEAIRRGDAPVDLRALRSDLPDALVHRVMRALREDPAERPATVAALGAILSEVYQRSMAEVPTGFQEGASVEPSGELGRVWVRGRIGSGAYGVVLRVRPQGGTQDFALKALKPEHRDDAQARERFLREARALQPICHPNVVRIRGVGELDGTPYVIMDLIQGPTLATMILRSGSLPPRRAASIAAGIARGLDAIHTAGMVHRDLKPHNVLVAGGDVPVIADFGMASLAQVNRLTMTGQAVGTPAYMAPEQLDLGDSSPSIDLWALGVMLYEMVTGKVPFEAEGTLEVMRAIRHAAPPDVGPEVPARLREVIEVLLQKDPGHRFPDAGSTADVLEGIAARG